MRLAPMNSIQRRGQPSDRPANGPAHMVMCRVSGGVTGTREAPLKVEGVVQVFPNKASAEGQARTLNEQHRKSKASFHYWAVPATFQQPTATFWQWQEFDGEVLTYAFAPKLDADEVLASQFTQHAQWAKEHRAESLRVYIPEVTPGVLRLYRSGRIAWSSQPSDLIDGVTIKHKPTSSVLEIEQGSGVTLVLKCVSKQHAAILAKSLTDGLASFDTRCD